MQLREPSFRRKTYQGYTAKKVGLELSIVLLVMFIKQKSRAVLKSKEREFGIRPNEESSILMVLLRGLDPT